jgi:predicted small lipoprotein YifL
MTGRPALYCATVLAGMLITGCGQKGALYLPEATGEVITRPTQTPSESPPAGDAATKPEDESPPRAPTH